MTRVEIFADNIRTIIGDGPEIFWTVTTVSMPWNLHTPVTVVTVMDNDNGRWGFTFFDDTEDIRVDSPRGSVLPAVSTAYALGLVRVQYAATAVYAAVTAVRHTVKGTDAYADARALEANARAEYQAAVDARGTVPIEGV